MLIIWNSAVAASALTTTQIQDLKNPYYPIYDDYMSSHGHKYSREEQIKGAAQYEQFWLCQSYLGIFLSFSEETSHMIKPGQMTKDEWFKITAESWGIEYPFTAENAAEGVGKVTQLAISLAYKYRGQGNQMGPVFWEQCLAIPLSLFMD